MVFFNYGLRSPLAFIFLQRSFVSICFTVMFPWLECGACEDRTHTCALHPLRRHAYSNILKILLPKKWRFSDKNSDTFHISAQNIDCGYSLEPPRRGGSQWLWYSLEPPRRGGSNEYHNLCFSAEIRKIMYTPVNPSFTTCIWKWGLRGSKLYRYVYVMRITDDVSIE